MKAILIILGLGLMLSSCEIHVDDSRKEKYQGLNSSVKMIDDINPNPLLAKMDKMPESVYRRHARWIIYCKQLSEKASQCFSPTNPTILIGFVCDISEPNYAGFSRYECDREDGNHQVTFCRIEKELPNGFNELFCGYWIERK